MTVHQPSRRGALLGLGLAAAPATARARAVGAWTGVDTVARRLVADRLTPGLQIAAMRGDRFVYSQGFGFANLETGTPMTPASVVRIGSASKPFMVAALLRLQEQGKLNVDDKLARYLPDFPRADDVTLRQLLTHISGLSDYTHTDKVLQQSRLDYTPAELLKLVADLQPQYIGLAGKQFVYSNSAYVVLGDVMEKAAGLPFAQIVRTLSIDPIGLKHSALDDSAEIVPDRASGYSPDDKAPTGFDNSSFLSISYVMGAGGMRSTCEDFCRFDAALHGGRLIGADSLKAMLTPVKLDNGAIPTERSGPPLAPPTPAPYGMGLYLSEDEHGRVVSHRGGLQGFITFAATYPDSDMRYAFVANADSGAKLGQGFLELRSAILKAAFA